MTQYKRPPIMDHMSLDKAWRHARECEQCQREFAEAILAGRKHLWYIRGEEPQHVYHDDHDAYQRYMEALKAYADAKEKEREKPSP